MKNDKSKIFILTAAALIIALGFAVVRVIFVVNYYNTEEGLYSANAPGVTAARIMFAVCLLVFGVLPFILLKKREYKRLPESNHGVVFTGALCGFMFISSSILVSYYFIIKEMLGSSVTGFFKAAKVNDMILFVSLVLAVIFGLLSSLYFFWSAATTMKMKKLNNRIFSMMPVLFCIFYLIYTYFRKDSVINSQERMILQLSVITVMLYFLSEARFHFGIARYRLYISASLISVCSIIVACIPNFMLSAFWRMGFSSDTVFSVLQVAVAAYIISRLICVVSYPEKTETAEA